MYALVKENQVVKLFSGLTQFEDKDGIGYTPSYLNEWTTQEKQEKGIYEVVYGSHEDPNFYNIVENDPVFEDNMVTITYNSTAKPLDTLGEAPGLKEIWIRTFKTTANSILAQTDWMVVRKIERNIDIPEETANQRAAIVTEYDRLETAINAATTVEQLITAVESASFVG
jgi:hypothetical protein